MSRVNTKNTMKKKRRIAALGSNSAGKKLGRKLKIFSVRSGLDLPLFFITLLILVIGRSMLFSASYPTA